MKIYLFPFLIDLVLFLVMLRLADAAGREMKLSNLQAALFMVCYSIVYLVTCLTIGRVLLSRQCAKNFSRLHFDVDATSGATLFHAHFLADIGFVFGLWHRGGAGIQQFSDFHARRSAARLARFNDCALHNFVEFRHRVRCFVRWIFKRFWWPVCAGRVYHFCVWPYSFYGLTHKAQGSEHESSDATVEDVNAEMVSSRLRGVDGRYVMIGWMLCLSANFSQRPLTTFIPKFYAENLSPPWVAGCLLFVMFITQAICGYACRKWRHLLYRPQPLVTAQLLVILALAVLWLAPGLWISAAMLLVLGGLFGFLFFSCVFYVSNDARSSHNVGINEAMVGVGTILGMLVSELSMRKLDNPAAYFPACMALTLLMIALQCGWLYWSAPKNQPLYCAADSIE